MTLQEVPAEPLSRNEYLASRFRMAGHHPHILALADHAFRWAAKEDSEDLMAYVLEYGAPVDLNALLRSAEVIRNSEAIALLEAKRAAADPLHLLTEPLYTACYYCQYNSVVAILNMVSSGKGKEALRSKDHRGRTALHYAVEGQHAIRDWEKGEELIQLLLNKGADPDQENVKGETAPISTEARNHYEAVKETRSGIPPTPEEAYFEIETSGTPADTRQPSSTDDEESSLKTKVSLRGETGNGSNKAEKVDGPKLSWWRSLLSPEAHLKPRKRMGTDHLGGDPSSRREDDLYKAAQEGRLGAKYLTYDPLTQGVKTVIMRPGQHGTLK